MANVQKLGAGAIGGLLWHDRRSLYKEYKDRPIERKNENIDDGRTHLNYSLLGKDLERKRTKKYVMDYVKDRTIKGLKKNANVCASWVVTLPVGMENDKEEFFKEAYAFLVERYGIESNANIISAIVHEDESTPHLHFVFVPMHMKEGNDKYTLNARGVINRTELSKFHGELSKHMEKKFGRDVGILNGRTVGMTVEGMKKVTKAIEEVDNEMALRTQNRAKPTMINYKSVVSDLQEEKELLERKNLLLIRENKLLEQVARNTENTNIRVKRLADKVATLEELEAWQITIDEKAKEVEELKYDIKELYKGYYQFNEMQETKEIFNEVKEVFRELDEGGLTKVKLKSILTRIMEFAKSIYAILVKVKDKEASLNEREAKIQKNEVRIDEYNQLLKKFNTLNESYSINVQEYNALKMQYDELVISNQGEISMTIEMNAKIKELEAKIKELQPKKNFDLDYDR